MSQLTEYKQRMAARLQASREGAKDFMNDGAVVLGAAAGGYIAAQKPDIAGVPTDAGLGIALYVGGRTMKVKTMKFLGVGMLAGYAYGWGASMGTTNPIGNAIPFQQTSR